MPDAWQIDAYPRWLPVGRPDVRAFWSTAKAYRGIGSQLFCVMFVAAVAAAVAASVNHCSSRSSHSF